MSDRKKNNGTKLDIAISLYLYIFYCAKKELIKSVKIVDSALKTLHLVHQEA